jgi:cytochrome c-type biogenesis protein CcmH/NrfG
VQPAIQGYTTLLQTWPDNMTALIGLGNAYYAAADLTSAEAVLRRAVQTDPANPIAHNNLAQVLFETGKRNEALQQALRAVEIGGPLEAVFRQTLEEIKSAVR